MKKFELNLSEGPIFSKILRFAIPLFATCLLQVFFNIADLVIVGKLVGEKAMSAIGATISFNSLILTLFFGLAVGVNCVVAKAYGAKNNADIRKASSTAILFSCFGGLVFMLIGLLISRPVLVLINTPSEILEQALRYIRICFLGIPFIVFYNFSCAILRAVGDTKRPFFFLSIGGVVNVLLNLFFVLVFKMEVAGVAIGTIASQLVSAILIFRTLNTTKEAYGFKLNNLSFDKKVMWEILRIGAPASLQSSCFTFSNILIQSSINSFGYLAVAGNTAVLTLEGVLEYCSSAFYHTSITAVSQNLGAQKYKRILKCINWALVCTIAGCLFFGFMFLLTGKYAIGIFNSNSEVISWGLIRIKILFTTFFICGIMDVAAGSLRGLGYSMISSTNSIVGICVFRIIWIWLVFPLFKSIECIFWVYPISWTIVAGVNWWLLRWGYRKVVAKHCSNIRFR
jgi:putative MATE family efflux protein